MKPKPRQPDPRDDTRLPAVGSCYVFPTEDGRFGLCRVLREPKPEERKAWGPCVIVATSTWVGSSEPDLTEPSVRELLRLTHHSWEGQIHMGFVGPPPPDVRLVGVVPPDDEESRIPCNSSGSWNCALQLRLQWRWDHDRAALLAEEAAAQTAREERASEQAEREAQRRATLSWKELRAKPRFVTWEEWVDGEVVEASRQLFLKAVDELEAMGPRPSERRARDAIKRLVEGFNQLDIHYEHFITTIEREDICGEIEEVAFLAGFQDEPQIADEWREW